MENQPIAALVAKAMSTDPAHHCEWPVIHGMGQCCGDTPCSVQWVRPCSAEGGCWDRATCPGCDTPVFKGEIAQRA